MNPKIGIKLADGSFYPVLDSSERGIRRRMTLSTSHDNQTNVRVDLYKEYGDLGATESIGSGSAELEVPEPELLAGPEFIGSLQIENVAPDEREGFDVELVLGIDHVGNLNAKVTDPRSGEYQSLSVSLADSRDEPIDDTAVDIGDDDTRDDSWADPMAAHDIKPFEDEAPEAENEIEVPGEPLWRPSADAYPHGTGSVSRNAASVTGPAQRSARTTGKRREGDVAEAARRPVNPVVLAGYVVFCLAVLALLVFLVFRLLEVQAAPDLRAFAQYEIRLSTFSFPHLFS